MIHVLADLCVGVLIGAGVAAVFDDIRWRVWRRR